MTDPNPTANVSPVDASNQPAHEGAEETHETQLIEAELLVEDVSIDGMCGVY